MSRFSALKSIICIYVVFFALTIGVSHAVVLDMEGIAPAGGSASAAGTTFMNGFDLGSTGGFFYSNTHPDILNGTHPSNGTDWLLHNDTNALRLNRSPLTVPIPLFSIQSFDATLRNSNLNGRSDINHVTTVTGQSLTNGILSTAFTVDDLIPFETFTFGSLWTDLRFVMFQSASGGGLNGGNIGYDNINVTPLSSSSGGGGTQMPEPGALVLFGMGLIGFGLIRRKRFC